MRRTALSTLLGAALLASAVAQVALPPLDARLERALADLETRDPAVFQTLRRALARDPEGARRILSHHARYLEDLASDDGRDPVRHGKLLEQEAMERKVRDLLRRFHETGEDAAERAAVLSALRAELLAWFEVRQSLRAMQIGELGARLAEQKVALESLVEPGQARRAWLDRVVRGAAPETEPTEVETLAPAIVQAILRRDPEAGEHLARLSQNSPAEFRENLRRIVGESPEILEEARRAAPAGKLALESALRDAILAAARLVRPFVGLDGSAAIPEGRRSEVEAALQAVVDAERAVVRANLAEVERGLERGRAILEFRRERKDLIVDLQLSRLTGGFEERYEW